MSVDVRAFEPPLTDEDLEPNNIDLFEPGTDLFYGDCGSYAYHEFMDSFPEPMIRCGTCHPELLLDDWKP